MTKHVHFNSRLAYQEGRLHLFPECRRRVIVALEMLGEATDRQIAAYIGVEVGSVRPRITELSWDRVIEEVGSIVCGETGKTVRVVKLIERKPQLTFDL